jgi:SAM-dependent methyltransferase
MPRAARAKPRLVSFRIAPPKDAPFKLRLAGAYQQREDGFIGLDAIKTDAVDHVIDLKSMPWPVDDAVVDAVFSAHYLHRLDMPERIAFFNEVYRILKPQGQCILVVPHWSSQRAIADPRAKWPPLSALSFVYFNKKWRENDHFDDIGINCDFGYGYGYGLDADLQPRNAEFQQHAIKSWINAAVDLHVTMTKDPLE